MSKANSGAETAGSVNATRPPTKDERLKAQESKAPTVSKPGGFDNDPDDPSNPNEVRERHLQKLRPGRG
jgi:hypothetical protein